MCVSYTICRKFAGAVSSSCLASPRNSPLSKKLKKVTIVADASQVLACINVCFELLCYLLVAKLTLWFYNLPTGIHGKKIITNY